MNDLMFTTLSAMQRDAFRLERVGANMANLLTLGFKREQVIERMSPANTDFENYVVAGGLARPLEGGQTETEVRRDLRAGPLFQTGRFADVALSGPGFFELRTPNGPAYTRQGHFRLDERGQLIGVGGNPVMGNFGPLNLEPGEFHVGSDGAIRQGDRTIGQLRVLVPDAGTRMQAIGDGLFRADGRMANAGESNMGLKQGFLEGSNVDTAQEMVQLIGAVRHFESMTRATQVYDEMMGLAVRKLNDL